MDPELKLRNEWSEVETEFLAAKKTRDKDPERYAVAKAKLHELRTHWRGIREAVDATVNEFAAKLGTIETKGRAN